jgi:flagellar M-ring protein FliF
LGLDASYWFKIIEAAILCVTALLIGLFVAKPLINRMFAAQATSSRVTYVSNASPVAGSLPAPTGSEAGAAPTADGVPALPPPVPSPIDVSRIDGQVRESSIKKVGEVVSAHPEEALAIIRTWLHQPV